eukprot:SAG11_NODE_3244_length_2585_cov_1.163315_1_plen_210_part_00
MRRRRGEGRGDRGRNCTTLLEIVLDVWPNDVTFVPCVVREVERRRALRLTNHVPRHGRSRCVTLGVNLRLSACIYVSVPSVCLARAAAVVQNGAGGEHRTGATAMGVREQVTGLSVRCLSFAFFIREAATDRKGRRTARHHSAAPSHSRAHRSPGWDCGPRNSQSGPIWQCADLAAHRARPRSRACPAVVGSGRAGSRWAAAGQRQAEL